MMSCDHFFSIRDGDGELILIEAANYLPAWLKPDTSTNRVSIYCFSKQVFIVCIGRCLCVVVMFILFLSHPAQQRSCIIL